MLYRLYTDGGYRAANEVGAWSYMIFDDNGLLDQGSGIVRDATNNICEYTALINGLLALGEFGAERALVISDSQLLIKQMQGKWQVKSENIKPLWRDAVTLANKVGEITFEWKPRENPYIGMCDKKCNDAMDQLNSI